MDGEMSIVEALTILLLLFAMDQVCHQNFIHYIIFLAFTGQSCNEGDIRLVSGAHSYEGRVEVCHNREWGTVCDDYWDNNDGIVACRQLGLQHIATAYFGPGTGQIWLDNLQCTGSESQLVNCKCNQFGSHNCDHYEDVGVVCGSKWSMIYLLLRTYICKTSIHIIYF